MLTKILIIMITITIIKTIIRYVKRIKNLYENKTVDIIPIIGAFEGDFQLLVLGTQSHTFSNFIHIMGYKNKF